MTKLLATILIEISQELDIPVVGPYKAIDNESENYIVASNTTHMMKLIANVPAHIRDTVDDPDTVDNIFTELADWNPHVEIEFGNYVIH